MIKHIVLWTLKEQAEGGSKAENLLKVKSALEALKEKIPGIVFLEVGINFDPTPEAFDISIYAEFKNEEDLKVYQKHPEHLKVVELLKKVRDKKAVVDYKS